MDARAPQSDLKNPASLTAGATVTRIGETGADADTRATKRNRTRAILMIGGPAIVAVAALVLWLMGGRYVTSDDAYVRASKLMVSAEVSGKVAEVDVKEGTIVKTGDVLFKLDPQPFEIALQNGKARLAQAMLDIASMKADYQHDLDAIESQKTQVALAQSTFDRIAKLAAVHFESRAAYDQARFALDAARSQLKSVTQEAQTTLVKLGGRLDLADADHPQVQAAQAAVDEAQRQLNSSMVRAPFDGTVTQVSQLQPGTYLVSSMASFVATSAVGLVSNGDMWVDVNLKETQLTYVRPGDAATVKIDTYPGQTWKAKICSISPTTGSEFSLLPAVNSSGNWVKVVQRLSVRLCFADNPGTPPLRAGMSANVNIDTGHTRSLANLF